MTSSPKDYTADQIQAGRCAGCGGPHDFDTSVPSVVWNRIIRARGLPDYLCTTCIVREFVNAGEGFTAQLWGDEFIGVSIEVVVNGKNANDAALVSDENNRLRVQSRKLREALRETAEFGTMESPCWCNARTMEVGGQDREESDHDTWCDKARAALASASNLFGS